MKPLRGFTKGCTSKVPWRHTHTAFRKSVNNQGARRGQEKTTCRAATPKAAFKREVKRDANNAQKASRTSDVSSGQRIDRKGEEGKLEHQIFDEVAIKVRAGRGGKGEIVKEGKGRMVKNFKYNPGGRQPKEIWLPSGAPAAGEHGADVVIKVDPGLDNLLHLHKRASYRARDGSNGNHFEGSQGSLRQKMRTSGQAEALMLTVPPGTVVKNKKGQLLGELLQPGQTLVVARGGEGGQGVTTPTGQLRPTKFRRQTKALDVEEFELEDSNFGMDADGQAGEEASLQLLLRVVADVGIVGLPNAGKSSLLAAMTRASPEVADYPFTTLMPNLGVVQGKEDFEVDADYEGLGGGQRAVLADLPGLIEGAHAGKGLGRVFLRHLRRTNAILHVLDASAEDPIGDYWVVREELRLYNPSYCGKPHVVALNKMDLEDACDLEEELCSDLTAMAAQMQKEGGEERSLPQNIISTSALTGQGLLELSTALCKLTVAKPTEEDVFWAPG